MPYIAHVGMLLAEDEELVEKEKWQTISIIDNIEYRWILYPNNILELVAGVFEKPQDALICAKRLYVNVFYYLLKNGIKIEDAGCSYYEQRFSAETIDVNGYEGDENYFFWNKHWIGGLIGPGVYEVNASLDEFDDYKFETIDFSISNHHEFTFDNIDKECILYCREVQECFHTIMLAERASNNGLKMTIYCGLLEHLSENKNKDQAILDVIDDLVKNVNDTTLSKENKKSLINFLNTGREESARKRCYDLCEKYAKKHYGKYTCKRIVNIAYGVRSAFSHGESKNSYKIELEYMKYIVLDVLENYFKEKEKEYGRETQI